MSDASTLDVINQFLATKGIYSLVLILLFLGLYGMIVSNNYMKKMMAMNVMAGCGYLLLSVLCPERRRHDSDPEWNHDRPEPVYQPTAACPDADGYRSKSWYYWGCHRASDAH